MSNKRKAENRNPRTRAMNQRQKMDNSCEICTIQLTTRDPNVSCSKCSLSFHVGCVGMSDRYYKHFIIENGAAWYCYDCNVELRQLVRDNEENIEQLSTCVQKVQEQLDTVTIDMRKLKASQQTSLQSFELEVMEKVDKHLSDFAKKVSGSEATQSNGPASSNNNNGRRRNVIIRGVPESSNESVPAIVKKIAKVINFMQSNFIDNCFRLSKRDNSDIPGSIILKFSTEMARDEFLKCYFSHLKNHPLRPSDIGLTGSDRIFVNEHMDPKLRTVMKMALELRKEKVLSNVSTHCNHISVKDNDGWHRIYTMEDLKKLQRIDDAF